jgi:ParB/RepB/Spo0J family partition protein
MAKAAKKTAPKVTAKETTTTKLRVIPKPGFKEIPIKELKPWPLQYREFVDEAALEELAKSIKEVGVLQPIITRKGAPTGHEVIAGQRRHLAAKKAGLSTIPCRTYDGISDDAAYELMLKENIDRADPHPLDEADAFLAYRKRWGGTVEQIAARFGKKLQYVQERLALEHLGDAARKAMMRGVFGLGVAHAIAQVRDPKLQDDAVKELTRGRDAEHPVTVSYARDEVKRRFMLRIVNAPFDTTDATMPGGACGPCPKRSGNQGTLFESAFGRDNMCTDAKCWDAKLEEFWKRTSARAKESGTKVLTNAEAKELFPYATSTSVHSRTWVDLNDSPYELGGGGKSWLTVLGKREAELAKRPGAMAIVRSPAGSIHRVALRAEILKVAKAHPRSTDLDLFKPKAKSKSGAEKNEGAASREVRERAAMIALEQEVKACRPGKDFLLAIARNHLDGMLDGVMDEDMPRLARVLGVDDLTAIADGEALSRELAHCDADALGVAVFAILAWPYELDHFLTVMGVKLDDPALIEKARAELAAIRASDREAKRGKTKPAKKTEAEPGVADDGDE